MKRTLKTIGKYFAVAVVALLLQELILYFRVLDTSAIDIPTAMNVKKLVQAGMDFDALMNLETVRIASTGIIGTLFSEVRTMDLRGSELAHLFERYPGFLITLEYGEGAEHALIYMKIAADRRITVSKGGRSYSGYISENAYELLAGAYDAADPVAAPPTIKTR